MTEVYFWVFCTLLLAALIRVLLKPARIYQFPYFMAATFAIFILPQAISLLRFPGAATSWAVEAVLLMTCLCLAASLLSAYFPVSRWVIRRTTQAVRDDRLFHAGIALIVVGQIANRFQAAAAQSLGGGPWTGSVTIYNFFASLVIPGFAIAFRTALRRRGVLPWLFTALAAWPSVEAAVFYGRRETATALVVIVGMTLFYQRRLIPPRSLVAGAIVFAMLMIPATGSYRSLAGQRGLSTLAQLDLVGNFKAYLNEFSILEIRNAAIVMDVTSLHRSYEFGTGYWDQLVWRFVPAQLLGAEFKEHLMFQPYDRALEEQLSSVGYQVPGGSTVTGVGDAFRQFGNFGCLFFLVAGIGVRSLWVASLNPGAVFAQLLYICTMTSAMRAVTHQTVDYLPGVVFYLIFLGAAVWYARDKAAGRLSSASRNRVVSARP